MCDDVIDLSRPEKFGDGERTEKFQRALRTHRSAPYSEYNTQQTHFKSNTVSKSRADRTTVGKTEFLTLLLYVSLHHVPSSVV
jgi:hypothetical protein